MRAKDRGAVMLIGTIESARAARDALLSARDAMPEGEHRDEIIALAIHLRYAIEDAERGA